MPLSLAQLRDEVLRLAGFANGETKTKVEELSRRLDFEVATLNDQLVAVTAENTKLKEDYRNLDTELTAARLTCAEFKAVNEALTDACLAAQLVTGEREQALTIPAAQKFSAYQGALNKAFLAANVPPAAMPTAPTAPVASSQPAVITREQFEAMSLEQRNAFFRSGGKLKAK